MGKMGAKPQKQVSTDWSQKLAYAIGLIATDGCLSGDGRHINFTSKDKSLVRTFKDCLGLKNVIGKKAGGYANKSNCYRVQFGDVNFYKWLVGIGLSPRKSKTIGELKIPNRYFFDFLRGSFDGDGSCYSYWDPRWKSSFMFYFTLNSASLSHLQWLRNKLKNLSGIKGYISSGGKRGTWYLRYAKKETRKVIKKIYYEKNLPHLERKYKKLSSILKQDGVK
ncbi:MAG: hypothetical protein A2117_01880 [Candidatus Wildermuthbacteria bacterium GWA2_46_15]|uniref:Homing endonuclease LAGLIDADG domain-containing protein n=1 Tax=Candidatus Wildermuthbacteria bacterium GWA2_46_15 TaxID=1802443 RepID=A0A1G2QQ51_9BACT|nr:MAG: hypothetical protein A2117_01880 [Candidatus Wildermuthbacteria bacterium GWA2_46_15]